MRIDEYMAKNALAQSRERAKSLILNGNISVNGNTVSKPSYQVSGSENIKITGEQLRYAGRGGLKLEKAVDVFGIDLKGKICADLGASTGGFTDCMLQNGAERVYAVDVGHGQLSLKLSEDSRVISMEGFNVRELAPDDLGGKVDFAGCDLSFISLKLVIPNIAGILKSSGEAVLLIKPQFECGRENLGKSGIVRSPKIHIRVIEEVISALQLSGLTADMLDFSPVCGGSGNIEYLVHTAFPPNIGEISCNAAETVKNSFSYFRKEKCR